MLEMHPILLEASLARCLGIQKRDQKIHDSNLQISLWEWVLLEFVLLTFHTLFKIDFALQTQWMPTLWKEKSLFVIPYCPLQDSLISVMQSALLWMTAGRRIVQDPIPCLLPILRRQMGTTSKPTCLQMGVDACFNIFIKWKSWY